MLTASQINQLKTLIKAEMARRSGYGSLSAASNYGYAKQNEAIDYSSSTYDFTPPPEFWGYNQCGTRLENRRLVTEN